MSDAEVDQPRFFAPGDDFDRKAERLARLAQELRRVSGDAQRIGADRAHGVARQPAQPLAEPGERLERARLAGAVEPLVLRQPGAELDLLAQRIERIHLAVDDAADQEMETVGTEVDSGEVFMAGHVSVTVTPRRRRRQPAGSSDS